MIVWITAVLLLALMGWIGYQQGALRAAISFIGLLVAAAVAVPLGSVLKPVLGIVGMKHPAVQQVVGPLIAFLVIYIVFQIIAHAVNQKFDLFYKYKMSDKARYKVERMNDRVGISVGLLSGVAMFILAMIPIYMLGYLTVQIASGAEDKGSLRFINKAREELRDTKFDRVVAAYDPAKPEVYEAFDIVGLIYHNPILESRLSRYPSFLTLAERPEFQQLANDVDFHNLWQGGASVNQLLAHPQVQAISTNAVLMKEIQAILIPDLKDLKNFLETGESEKYGEERILGRWQFDFAGTVSEERKSRSSISANELRQMRSRLAAFWGSSLVATIEKKVLLKRGEKSGAAADAPRVMAEGTWERGTGLYKVTIDGRDVEVIIEDGKRLLLPWGDVKLIFNREL